MELSREYVFEQISNAALFGSLGFFIGTGFSKALTDGKAPSFQELLEEVCGALNIDYDFNNPANLRGKSYPRIAQELVEKIRRKSKHKISIGIAKLILKRSISKVCDLIPEKEISNKFRKVFKGIPPQWVITTNYDFIIEDVIPGSVCLLPNQILIARTEYVPIYHLHGHCRSPYSIIVTENDYTKLLAPIEYRQLKLNLLLAESTTIMLGYSFGDINVQSAIEWSRSFRDEQGLKNEPYQSLVVQGLYVRNEPKEKPYRGINGEIILETNDLYSFLKEIRKSIKKRKKVHLEAIEIIDEWLDEKRSSSLVADDTGAREDFVKAISEFQRCYDVHKLISFLNSVIDPIWSKARSDGGFEHYDHYLNVLLDIIVGLPIDNIHPSLFSYLAARLDDVSYYMEADGKRRYGTSWDATSTWQSRKEEIPNEMKREFKKFAKKHGGHKLLRLLEN
jgi:hypothetical protein